MKFGVIDLGSNALRFSVYEKTDSRSHKMVHRERHLLQLGTEVFRDNRLSEKSFDNTIAACMGVRRSSFRFRIRNLMGVATSAVRDAGNGEQFLSAVAKKSGLPLAVISGSEEARLIGQAVAYKNGLDSSVRAVVDIGGGSTELSILKGSKVSAAISLPFGGARLGQELYSVKTVRARRKRLEIVCRTLRHQLYSFLNTHGVGQIPQILGSSGTIRSLLTNIANGSAESGCIKRSAIKIARTNLEQLSVSEIRTGLSAKCSWRATHLLGASMILEETMNALGSRTVAPINASLADGIAVTYLTLTSREDTPALDMPAWATRFCA